MIGSYYKKIGLEMGLKEAKGNVYGIYQGYLISLFESAGIKSLYLNLALNTEADYANRQRVAEFIEQRKKEFKIANFQLDGTGLEIAFQDSMGTPKRIREFLDQLVAFLRQIGVCGAECCCVCGQPHRFGQPRVLRRGNRYFAVDEEHMQGILGEHEARLEEQKSENKGKSYWLGLLGGILGMIVGMIPWMIVSHLGYYASILGFAIGFCVLKGYDILKGKPGVGKIITVAALSLVGVFLAEFVVQCIDVYSLLLNEYAYVTPLGDLIAGTWNILFTEPEITGSFVLSLAMGMIFALLGLYSLLRNLVSQHKGENEKVEVVE